jgi:hypothetical protein
MCCLLVAKVIQKLGNEKYMEGIWADINSRKFLYTVPELL